MRCWAAKMAVGVVPRCPLRRGTEVASQSRQMRLARGYPLTILVVEDDEALAELLRLLLNRVPGWGATVVRDAAAAREVFHHLQVDLLVLDVNLPGISGLELLPLLRADPHWHDQPVVLMSADPGQPAIQEAVTRGDVAQFLAKPFDVDALLESVGSVVGVRSAEVSAVRRSGAA